MMWFQKKINNSVAWVENDEKESMIAIGKGVAFGKQAGDIVTDEEIERIFKADKEEDRSNDSLNHAIASIPSEIILLTEEISAQAVKSLEIKEFDNSHFLSLADHLNYALKRTFDGTMDYPENIRWEVKRLYPKEYDVAIDTLFYIEKKTGICLPRSEETFLTYHFVNAQYDAGVNIKSIKLAELINRSVEIIQYHYQIVLDQNTVTYVRFVTHLRYFILRQDQQGDKGVNVDPQLVEIVKKNYRKAYQAAIKVSEMIIADIGGEVIPDELFYLTLHIARVTERKI